MLKALSSVKIECMKLHYHLMNRASFLVFFLRIEQQLNYIYLCQIVLLLFVK